MTDLFLSVDYRDLVYNFPVAHLHDDETDPGRCHMVVSLNSATKLQALLHEKKRGELKGALMERVREHDVPVEDHRELRIIRASAITSLLDASVVGGGEVVAEILG